MSKWQKLINRKNKNKVKKIYRKIKISTIVKE